MVGALHQSSLSHDKRFLNSYAVLLPWPHHHLCRSYLCMQSENASETYWTDEVKYWKSKDREQEFYLIWWCVKRNVVYFDEGILRTSVTLTGTSLWIRTLPRRVGQRDVSRLPLFLLVYQQSTERNLSPDAKDVSAHYLAALRPRGTKVTASNLTCRDGNLSDTLNNLLMQKLKGLSVSLGGGEESRALDNGADVQDAGLCPSAEGRQTAEEGRWQSAF